jgi:anaerobic magnesium-protoporphyrin IX monomethyl ester cyclase
VKVALLYPEVYDMARFKEHRKEFPPFGVLYLAAVIEQAGHTVAIRKVTPDDGGLDLGDFDAVGFSLASSATYGVMRQARERASIRDDALVMVGGVHCDFYPEQSLRDFGAHVATDGESEETILEILDRASSRRFEDVPGVLWPDGTALRRGRPRPLLRDIDQLPLPARHLLPADDFVISDRLAGIDLRMAHVMFSRGCPFPCGFCAAGQTRIVGKQPVSWCWNTSIATVRRRSSTPCGGRDCPAQLSRRP